MGKMFSFAAIALLFACVAWAWITLRKYSARKREEEARAAAFMAETASALRKNRTPQDKA